MNDNKPKVSDAKIRNKFTEMSKIFKDVIDEYEILKNQNVMLQEENQGLREELDIAFFQYDKLKEESLKIKSENLKLEGEIELQKDYIDALPENIEELKEEINITNSENYFLKYQLENHKKALMAKIEEGSPPEKLFVEKVIMNDNCSQTSKMYKNLILDLDGGANNIPNNYRGLA